MAASSSTGRGVLVVGWGGMGRMYAEALRARDALAGLLVRSEATAARARAELEVPAGTSLERILDESAPRALAIFTTTEWHATYVRAAIARRLPSLVIKPATVRPETAEALYAEARAVDVAVIVAHEGVYQPAFLALEQAAAEGRIGAVREIRWLKEGEDPLSGGRLREPPGEADQAGRNYGFVYATAMHDLYVANRLAGRVAPTEARVTALHASSVALRLEARVDYPRGVVARLRHQVAPGLPFRRGLQVVGERGSLLWLMEPGRSVLQLRLGSEVRDLPRAGHAGSSPATPVVAALLARLDDPASPLAPIDDLADGARALRAARLLTAAAAAHHGAEVDLDALAGGHDR
jgi:predicted dehydrogenase